MSDDRLKANLYELARLYNIQTAYYGLHHRRQQASVESLLGALKAMGAPVFTLEDVSSVLRERRQALSRRIIEPVTVAWDGGPAVILVRLPANAADVPATGYLELESGESFNWKWSAEDLPATWSTDSEGKRYVTRKIKLLGKLPEGYHKFIFQTKGNTAETMIISAPMKAYAGEEGKREWGVFLPLYALRREDGWGSGDYSGLGALSSWVGGRGGNVVATLPLLPVFLDAPFEPSPYAPVSRLLWNEFYVDITKAPELAACDSARSIMESEGFQAEIKEQQARSMVDYRGVMSMKRRVLEELSRCLLNSSGARLEEFKRFAVKNPMIKEYARFRAVMERRGKTFHDWPQRLRDGKIQEGDYDKDARDYHLYAQWLAHQQVKELSENSRKKGIKLYFDLPVGVHRNGYDAWRERDVFTLDARLGAPPDAVFTSGQDWGFPPLHPERIKERHYRHFTDYLRHNLKYADMLRIDHVMGLHRLFWIPQGFDAGEGVYVHYNAEELYAILCLESHRSKSVIVGEDLGIVPPYVRPAMKRHGLARMYILYYELADNKDYALRRVTQGSIASLNTHDMPTFAAFWQGNDITERKNLGLADAKQAIKESRTRQKIKSAVIKNLRKKRFLKEVGTGTQAVLRACLSFLSASPARVVLVNLEDLWGEKKSQNVPGSGEKYPSWQKKARYTLEEFCRMKAVRDILNNINILRKRGRKS